ncbi:MAG: hypothetical protein K0S54_2455 [Alphaproteobacteria bacterium]|nr:hypothetical protein [Alphaproteobacteria bacterium]
MRDTLLHGTALALVLLAAPFLSSHDAAARVGVTSTTTGEPLGTPPAQAQRVLKVGIDVFANERIQTKADDRAHLLFADGSALTIGPNSDLMIDKYVYDPNSGTGDLAISATRGVFRLVGGKITKQGDGATMKVGTATLGLRGGIAIIDASKPNGLDAFFMFGTKLTVSTPQGTRVATRPGSTISTVFGQQPSSPSLTPAGALTGPLASLEAPSGQTVRGSTGVDTKVSQSGLSQVNSDKSGTQQNTTPTPPAFVPPEVEIRLKPVSVAGGFVRDTAFINYDPVTGNVDLDPANNTGLVEAGTFGGRLVAKTAGGTEFNLPWAPGSSFAVNTGNATSSLGPISGGGYVSANEDFYFYTLLDETAGKKINVFAGDATLASAFPTSGVSTREMLSLDVARPFLGETVSALPVVANAAQSPMFIAHSPILSAAQQAGSPERATWFQGSLNFEGTGAAQSSFLSINIGQFGSDANGALYSSGSGQASLRENGSANSTRFTSNISTAQTNTGSAIFGATGDHFVFLPDKRNDDGQPDQVTSQAGGAQDLASLAKTPYYYVTATAPLITPAELGVNQNSRTMQGYTAGQVDRRDTNGNITSSMFASGAPSDVTVSVSASRNRASARFEFSQVGNASNDYDLRFGSQDNVNANSSSFVDDTHFALGTSPASTSFGKGQPVVANVAMVTHQAVGNDPDLLPPGVAYCECEFMSWGYWTGEVKHQTGALAGQTDRVHLSTWVAGTLPDLAAIPLDGTAQYQGHAIGNVTNNGASYTAVGEFRQTWNFENRSGALQINSFDGGDYSSLTSAGNGRDFSGTLTGNAGTGIGRGGAVAGSFFASPTSPVAGQGGNFTINGTGYSAAGTFAGQKQ